MKTTERNTRCYSELVKLPTFIERFRYLADKRLIGEEIFGFERYINQKFYQSAEWRQVRNYVITRDMGCDLGIPDRVITSRIFVHHMKPIRVEDLTSHDLWVINPEYLITVSDRTHNALHYGDESLLMDDSVVERTAFDTCPWKQKGE